MLINVVALMFADSLMPEVTLIENSSAIVKIVL